MFDKKTGLGVFLVLFGRLFLCEGFVRLVLLCYAFGMNNNLEEIKNRLNVVDVLGDYLRLEKSGAGYRALCPFHNEKSPSFMISEEKQIWHCFGCQKGGDIFTFIMEIEGLEFREALKLLAEKAGVKLEDFDPRLTEKKNRVLEILELATKFYEYQLWGSPGKGKILEYLLGRGLNDETIKLFRLGYAPKGWRNVIQFLLKRGYQLEEIAKTGLAVQSSKTQGEFYDRFRERIIFPICDYSGRVLGYSARMEPGGDEKQAKYVNTPETEVYHKSRILYGIDKAKVEIRQKDFVLLVEGNMDVIAAYQAGIKNVVAVSGTALTVSHLDILKRYTKNLKLLFDMDEAGELATKKSARLCLEKDFSLQIVELPFGKDAADVAKSDPEKLRRAVNEAQGVMDYFFGKNFSRFDKGTAEGKKRISTELLELINGLSNNVEKSHWLKKLAVALDVPEAALTEEYKKVRLGNSRTGKMGGSNETSAPLPASPKEKLELLIEEVLGLALASGDVWRMVKEKSQYHPLFAQNKLLAFMVEFGPELEYDFDRLLGRIEIDLREQVQSLFFRKKFRQGLNNSPEEVPLENFQIEAENVFGELGRELKRTKLENIAKDLALAEEARDATAAKFLRQEFEKIRTENS